MWIERQHTQKIRNAVQRRPVILLTGVRQAGKSSLLRKLFPEREYVTLDKITQAQEAEENPTRFLNRFKGHVIIDEIQYAPSLFRDLKIKVDQARKQTGKWILTGSQQFTLMQQVSESLAGRISILTLSTLNANELNNSGLLQDQHDMLWKGGFPEIWSENLDAEQFYDDYIQTYLERDLRQILNVSNLRDFRRFLSMLALRTGQILNYSNLAKDIGVSVNTIKSWINALEISGIVRLLVPYYNNLGKRLVKAPKVYFCDNGLVASLLNIHSLEALNDSPHLGNLWENFVFSEFEKNGFSSGKNIFYFRDQNGVEIDFILEKDAKTFLIEAKNSERHDSRKFNFKKVAPLFKHKVECLVACNVDEQDLITLNDYSLYNPLRKFPL